MPTNSGRNADVDDSRSPGTFSVIRFGMDNASGGEFPEPDSGQATFDSSFDGTFE